MYTSLIIAFLCFLHIIAGQLSSHARHFVSDAIRNARETLSHSLSLQDAYYAIILVTEATQAKPMCNCNVISQQLNAAATNYDLYFGASLCSTCNCDRCPSKKPINDKVYHTSPAFIQLFEADLRS